MFIAPRRTKKLLGLSVKNYHQVDRQDWS